MTLHDTFMHTSSRVAYIIFCCNTVLQLGDLKVVALLVGCSRDIQNTYFLHVSERDGRIRELKYLRQEWTRRQNVAVREKNIQHSALMSRQNPATTRDPFTSNHKSDEELRESHGPDF